MYKNYSYLYKDCLPNFGGSYGGSIDAGAFCLYVIDSAACSYAFLSVRLMFL